MQEGLLRYVWVLLLLGCTAWESRHRFAPARHRSEHTSCHVDSLRYGLKRTLVRQFYDAFTRCRACWIKAGFSKRRGTYILDAMMIALDDKSKIRRMTQFPQIVVAFARFAKTRRAVRPLRSWNDLGRD